MKILSFCSKEINDALEKEEVRLERVGENGLIETLYYKDDIKEDFKLEIKDKTLEDIRDNNDVAIFDLITITKKYYSYKHRVFSENNINYFKEQNINQQYMKEIDELSKEELFFEAFKVVINKLVKFVHTNNIFIIKILFNEINEESKRINTKLLEYYNLAIKVLPGIRFIECEELLDNSFIKIDGSKILNKINKETEEKEVFKNERIHRSINNVRYVYEKAKMSNTNKLIVVFSAFSIDIPKYNYVSFFKTIDCNKLFILDDYGEKGCYYLGLDGRFDLESSVMSLISTIMSINNINFNDVIAVGSSKGGSAALYYGYKYGFGNIISGAPQYKIGSYLIDLSIKDYAKEIFGDLSYKSRIKYDSLIRMVLNSNGVTKAKVLTSEGDNQYKRVLKELERENQNRAYGIQFVKCEIENHGEIAKVFPEFLEKSLNEILEGKGIYSKSSIFKIIKGIKKRGELK